MKAVGKKINHFAVIDDKGTVQGQYYLNYIGEVVELSNKAMVKPVLLPYVVSFNIDDLDDVCTMHVSEIEELISKLKSNLPNIQDDIKRAKYEGYIEALNYVVSHNSYIDPWDDFIHNIEESI